MQKVKDDFANFVTDMGKLEQEAIAVDFEEPLASELKGFIAAVKGNPEKCLVQADDAKEALRIALDAVSRLITKERGNNNEKSISNGRGRLTVGQLYAVASCGKNDYYIVGTDADKYYLQRAEVDADI